MHWFVFYADGYTENGDIGLEAFVSKDDALQFIDTRLAAKGSDANIKHYMLIEGWARQLVTREVTTKVQTETK